MKKIIIGVMGPGKAARETDIKSAFELGKLIAGERWVLLSGGMRAGVMDAASRGAASAGGLTVGVLPTADSSSASASVDIAIVTGMGSARNNINVLSSDLVMACGMGPGTASEVSLAIKANKKVVLLNCNEQTRGFFQTLTEENLFFAGSPKEAVAIAKKILRQL